MKACTENFQHPNNKFNTAGHKP